MLSLFKTYAMKKIPILILSIGATIVITGSAVTAVATQKINNKTVYVNIDPEDVKPFSIPDSLMTDHGKMKYSYKIDN
jgi:uncharacterized protein YxeA